MREAVQVLDRTGLVLYDAKPPGPGNYTITRLGSDALESNAVNRIIGGGSL